MTQAMLVLFVPLAALQAGASPSLVGLLVTSAYVLPIFLAMPLGALVDRWGSPRLLLASALAQVVAAGIVVIQPSLALLFASQVANGLSHLGYVVAGQRYVSALGVGSRGERNFGWFSTFQSSAQMVGAVLGGVLLDLTGVRAAFAAAALAPLLAALAVGRLPRLAERLTSSTHLRLFGEPGEVKALLAKHGVRLAIAVSCSVLVVGAVRQTFFPVYLDALAYPATTIGLLVSARGFAAMVVRPVMARFVNMVGGRSAALLATVVILAIGTGMTALVVSFVPLLVASLFVGVGAGFSQPLTVVTVADHVSRDKVGFALGLRLTANRLAQALSPLLIGLIAESIGVRWSFAVAAAVVLATAPLILRWRREFEAAEARLRADAHSGTPA